MGSTQPRGGNRERGQGRTQGQGGEIIEGNGDGVERKEGQVQDGGGHAEGEEEEDNVVVEVSSAQVVKHPNNEVRVLNPP